MELGQILQVLVTSTGLSIGGGWLLSKMLIAHKLAQNLEKYKSAIQQEANKNLELYKLALQEESTRRKVELDKSIQIYLGEQAAMRQYNFDAKKRLYNTIGPLKFQLLLACNDLVGRIKKHPARNYTMSVKQYYGLNTIYRILKPLAIAQLIEYQIAHADFAVDSTTTAQLCFKRSVFKALSGSTIICNHPKVNWHDQTEHLFDGTLSKFANLFILRDEDSTIKKRVIHFHEFEELFSKEEFRNQFEPIVKIIEDFQIKKKPLFWCRLVCLAYVCNKYILEQETDIKFTETSFEVESLFLESEDTFINNNIANFKEACELLWTESL